MQEDQKILISEQETAGTGHLYQGETYLGKCEYHLKIRRSRLKIRETWPSHPSTYREYLITTIIGSLVLEVHSGNVLSQKHLPLILHLNDDYLLPLCTSHEIEDGRACKVFGRLVALKDHLPQ